MSELVTIIRLFTTKCTFKISFSFKISNQIIFKMIKINKNPSNLFNQNKLKLRIKLIDKINFRQLLIINSLIISMLKIFKKIRLKKNKKILS
jgi:hypothetical protein